MSSTFMPVDEGHFLNLSPAHLEDLLASDHPLETACLVEANALVICAQYPAEKSTWTVAPDSNGAENNFGLYFRHQLSAT